MADLRSGIDSYLPYQFTEHLRATDIEASEEILPDDAIWSFLNHLCRIVYYLPAFDTDPDPHQIQQVWLLIETTLLWVQEQQKVGSANIL